MKVYVNVAIEVEGDFEFPEDAMEFIESELSFSQEVWENNIKDIGYNCKVKTLPVEVQKR
jgi:hypothetical protein